VDDAPFVVRPAYVEEISMKCKLVCTLVALSMLPLVTSAADMRSWSVTMLAPDNTTVVSTGTFSADATPTYLAPVVDFDSTVNGVRYDIEPSVGGFDFYYNNYVKSLYGFILSSPGDGEEIPCIGFDFQVHFGWSHYSCKVQGGSVTSAVLATIGGTYTIQEGPTATPATLSGFYPPVDSPAVATNLVKAGQTIPLKFYAETTSGPITDLATVDLSIISTGCEQLDEGMDAIDSYVNGTSVLLQNLGGGYYQYNWKTVKGESGCRILTLALPETYAADALVAGFKFRK
jgi:hypothetical protein